MTDDDPDMIDQHHHGDDHSPLERAIEVWAETRIHAMESAETGHLPDRVIQRLAAAGGVANGAPEEVEHLSLCPLCLERLAAAGRDEEETVVRFPGAGSAPTLDYGLLEAAASDRPAATPIRTTSRSGRYTLTILPEIDRPERGLITLEATGVAADTVEGVAVSVKDSGGRTLLRGRLHNGRVASNLDDVTAIDLSRGWTLVIHADP